MKRLLLRNCILIFSILILSNAASAAETRRIAVLPFSTKNVSKVTGEIVRDIIEVELISSRRFTVLERDQMGEILKEQALNTKGCDEAACAFKYGKALSIDYMVIGKVMKLDNFVVSLRLIDVRNRVVLSADKLKSEKVKGLESAAEELVERFLKQLSSDNPAPYKQTIYQNRRWTILQTFYFQYSYMADIQLNIFNAPEQYGDKISFIEGAWGRHGYGGGLSTSIGLSPFLSFKGDLNFMYIPWDSTEFNVREIDLTEARFNSYGSTDLRLYSVSGNFLIQLNYVFNRVMPFIGFGLGYTYNSYLENPFGQTHMNITSKLSGTNTDSYRIDYKFNYHFISLAGEIGITIFFNNTTGLTTSLGVHYAPNQPILTSREISKVSGEITTGDPILDIYKNIHLKIKAPDPAPPVILNLRFGFTFRIL